jgi:GSH-dependent disulfide-bond oxidoreductase
MIDVYTAPTPNGVKVPIALEELELPYRIVRVDLGTGEQKRPEFLEISPNGRIPAIVDPDGPSGRPIAVFESGAILFYLASKTGKFLPQDVRDRWTVMQWVMFQMGHIGPMLGQAHHFLGYAPEKIEYAMNRYRNEANRLYGVLDRRLKEVPYVAGREYTIADMAIMPWLRSYERQGVNMDDYPNVRRWFDKINERPAVKRGLQVLADRRRTTPLTPEQREVMFGAKQYERR